MQPTCERQGAHVTPSHIHISTVCAGLCVISKRKSPATVMPHLFNAFLSLSYIEAIKVKCIKICRFLWFAYQYFMWING